MEAVHIDEPDGSVLDNQNSTKKTSATPKGFSIGNAGVYRLEEGKDGPEKIWVCSKLEVISRTRSGDSNQWGYLLRWKDPDGTVHEWAMPAEMAAGSGENYRAILLDGGLQIAPGTKARNWLGIYIQSANVDRRIQCTSRTGWHGDTFVMPHMTIPHGGDGGSVLFQNAYSGATNYGQQGTLSEWRQHVAALCAGNTRMVFNMCVGFAGPMIELTNDENGGFHIQGGSSKGKTTCLLGACSLYGDGSFWRSWRATGNGLEAVATQHSGSLLVLDEIGEVGSREAGSVAYMLANGHGKTRADRSGGARQHQTWRLLFLSSGEIDLAEHMRESGMKAKAGQEVRLLSYDCDAGKNMGVFENLHGYPDGAKLAVAFKLAAAAHYGVAGPEFIRMVCNDKAGAMGRLAQFRTEFLRYAVDSLTGEISGQVRRAGNRFALVAAAGELATEFGITGWAPGESIFAAKACFQSWLNGRGGTGDRESTNIIAQVQLFLEQHGDSRFATWYDDRPVHNRAGFRREVEGVTTYYILPETFTQEVCKGYQSTRVAKVLDDHGMLVDKDPRKYQKTERLPGMGTKKCYVVQINESTPKSGGNTGNTGNSHES